MSRSAVYKSKQKVRASIGHIDKAVEHNTARLGSTTKQSYLISEDRIKLSWHSGHWLY